MRNQTFDFLPKIFASHPDKSPALRLHLAGLVLACVVPVWLIAGFLVYHAYTSKLALETGHMLETARALSMSVDRELANAQAALQTLATSPVFAAGDLKGIYDQARELIPLYPEADIIVADSAGQQLVNSYRPFGTSLPKRNTPETVRRIFQYGRPIISDLYFGAVTKRPLIAIDVPVFLNGTVAYDLSMTLPSSRLASILAQQRLPHDWYGTILDGKGVVVSRTRDPQRFVGKTATSAIRRAIAGSSENIITSTNLEGINVFNAFSRSKTSNWTVVIGIPVSSAMRNLYSWLIWAVGCATILSFFGIAMATWIGNRIAQSFQALVSPAMQIGAGEPVTAIPSIFVSEAESVAQALLQTSRLLEKRAAERTRAEAALKDLNESLEKRIAERTAELSASEGRLRLAQEAAKAGSWEWDLVTGENIWSGEVWKVYGIEANSVTPSHEAWLRLIHPDDREKAAEAMRSAAAEGTELNAEWRVQDGNGSQRWLLTRGMPFPDARCKPERYSGIVMDITERKQAELALRQTHDELAGLVEQRTAQLQEKEVLLKEIHHRVKNNLQVISSLVSLQADGVEDGTVGEVLRDVSYRVRSMAMVHEKLYQSADLAHIDFAEYSRSLLSYLWRAHGAVAATIRLTLELEPVTLPVDTAVPCGLILNELAGNALKHAFADREEGEVIVFLRKNEEGAIRLGVADDGVGLPSDLDWRQAHSLGLRLVQMLARQLNAGVEENGVNGTCFEVTFMLDGLD